MRGSSKKRVSRERGQCRTGNASRRVAARSGRILEPGVTAARHRYPVCAFGVGDVHRRRCCQPSAQSSVPRRQAAAASSSSSAVPRSRLAWRSRTAAWAG
ncbi:hypothetical protein ACFFX0_17840 [Citricoccus parietis]|uniref:Uncharacterized protein n=1 Tax=Citricoccus parietis TaxID=592307 RepID=A0ABV5G202_9MICC